MAILNIYKLMHIRHFVDQKTMEILTCSLLISHLDCASGILLGTYDYIRKLQVVQIGEAKLLLNKMKYDSSTDAYMCLHWLWIRYRIRFKILLLVKKCLSGNAPKYLCDLLCYNYRRYAQRLR